ncbi:hypothetical protein, partial [Paracidovorax cattleyae]|uniref:hypothetical protein n=1 Tax=Paracidovorax cattleyae TaxID=80868 RepID=UPI000D1FEA7E
MVGQQLAQPVVACRRAIGARLRQAKQVFVGIEEFHIQFRLAALAQARQAQLNAVFQAALAAPAPVRRDGGAERRLVGAEVGGIAGVRACAHLHLVRAQFADLQVHPGAAHVELHHGVAVALRTGDQTHAQAEHGGPQRHGRGQRPGVQAPGLLADQAQAVAPFELADHVAGQVQQGLCMGGLPGDAVTQQAGGLLYAGAELRALLLRIAAPGHGRAAGRRRWRRGGGPARILGQALGQQCQRFGGGVRAAFESLPGGLQQGQAVLREFRRRHALAERRALEVRTQFRGARRDALARGGIDHQGGAVRGFRCPSHGFRQGLPGAFRGAGQPARGAVRAQAAEHLGELAGGLFQGRVRPAPRR